MIKNRQLFFMVQHQLYYGWFDGDPANLNPLPPATAAKKYIDYMGGVEEVLGKVQKDIENGEHRWAAMVLNQVIFADSNNKKARQLLSTVYTHLGYQAESGPWRNFYLTRVRGHYTQTSKGLLCQRANYQESFPRKFI